MAHSFDPLTIKSGMVSALYSYWLKRRGDRLMPRRADIEPGDIKPLLPNLFLSEFETEPFRVRYRLIGTEIVNHARYDFTGRYLDELDFSAYDTVDWEAEALKDTLRLLGEERFELKLGKAQAPVRVAVTGRTVGPPLFEGLVLLRRDETLRRLRAARVRL